MFFKRKVVQQEVSIAGMKCEHCAANAKQYLESIEGVKSVKVSLKDKKAIIESKNGIDEELVYKAVSDAGYLVLGITTL